MEFFKILLLLLCNRPGVLHVSQLGVDLSEIAGYCNSWRHWIVDLCRAGYLESQRRGWYRITNAGQQYCEENCQQFDWARSHATNRAVSVAARNSNSVELSNSHRSSVSEVETSGLIELWRWSAADSKKMSAVTKKLLKLKSPTYDRVRAICAELWGAVEEIPPKLLARFERAVEATVELLESRG